MLILDSSRWAATFYDGKVADPKKISLIVKAKKLSVIFDDSQEKYLWNYADLKVIQKPKDGLPAILTNSKLPGSQIIISKECFLGLKRKLKKPPIDYKQIIVILAFIIIVLVLIIWIIPRSATYLAKVVPNSVRENLSNIMLEHITNKTETCYIPKLDKELNDILLSLKDSKTKHSKIIVLKSDGANAFALPNGNILIFSKLITNAKTPEEVTGVIAHELGHIAHNHSMQRLIRQMGIAGIIDIATGGGGTMIYLGTQLYNNSYNRDEEKEADQYSAKSMLKAKYSLDGMYDLFTREKNTNIDKLTQKGLRWISTHPADEKRAEFFKNHSQNYPTNEIVRPEKWKDIQEWAECKN